MEIGRAPRGPRSSPGIEFAAAALLLVLLHINAYGTCEALRLGSRQMTVTEPADEAGSLPISTQSTSAPPPPPQLAVGMTYRPPIISFKYQGGPVMWKPIHVYLVWYGTWTKEEKKLMRTAINSFTPKKRNPIQQYPNLTNLWKIVTEYYQEPQSPGEGRKYVSNKVSIAGEVDDNYSLGKSIDGENNAALDIITSHLGKGLPYDLEQGQYILLSSRDVDPNFSSFCSFHDNQCINRTKGSPFCDGPGNNIIYSYLPYPTTSNRLLVPCGLFHVGRSPVAGGLPGVPPNSALSPDGALDTVIDALLQSIMVNAVDPRPPGNSNPNYTVAPAWILNITEGIEPTSICTYNFAAGDWNYCGFNSAFPDFPGLEDRSLCRSFRSNPPQTLTDPRSHKTFNIYGIDGSTFVSEMVWSLKSKGCALQPEGSCSRRTVNLRQQKGTIQRGLFVNGAGLQHYAPGQSCSWKILVHGAKCITLYFEKVALGFDDLDFVTVTGHDSVVKKKVTGFGKNIKVKVIGNEATIHFVTYGGRSPNPSAAGFIMHYEAGF